MYSAVLNTAHPPFHLNYIIITYRFIFEVAIDYADEKRGQSAGAHQPAQQVGPPRELVAIIFGGRDVRHCVNENRLTAAA